MVIGSDSWIKDICDKTENGYDKWDMCKRLSSDPYITEQPVHNLLKMDRPIVASISLRGDSFYDASEIKTKYVEPQRCGIKINLFKVKDELEILDRSNYWHQVGKHLALQEYSCIINSMIKNAEVLQEYSTNEVEIDQIKFAANKISKYGIFPYDVVMNNKDIWKIKSSNGITPIRNIPESYISTSERGPHFNGLISYLKVHDAPFLDKTAVVFDKNEIQIATTKIQVEYEKGRRYRNSGLVGPFVYVEKTCTSEPILNSAVSVVKLK